MDEISIRSVGMPVSLLARCLASSINSRRITQLSTTTNAIRVCPSSSTKHRACNGSAAFFAGASCMFPFIEIGNFSGVTSIANAPAFNSPAVTGCGTARQRQVSRTTPIADKLRFMASSCSLDLWSGVAKSSGSSVRRLRCRTLATDCPACSVFLRLFVRIAMLSPPSLRSTNGRPSCSAISRRISCERFSSGSEFSWLPSRQLCLVRRCRLRMRTWSTSCRSSTASSRWSL